MLSSALVVPFSRTADLPTDRLATIMRSRVTVLPSMPNRRALADRGPAQKGLGRSPTTTIAAKAAPETKLDSDYRVVPLRSRPSAGNFS